MKKCIYKLINNSLQKLDLSMHKIINVDSLGKALEVNSSLQQLNLSNNKIVNIDSLCKSLEFNYFLNELYLTYNNIKNRDINELKNKISDFNSSIILKI